MLSNYLVCTNAGWLAPPTPEMDSYQHLMAAGLAAAVRSRTWVVVAEEDYGPAAFIASASIESVAADMLTTG
jgi:hypothetical protein